MRQGEKMSKAKKAGYLSDLPPAGFSCCNEYVMCRFLYYTKKGELRSTGSYDEYKKKNGSRIPEYPNEVPLLAVMDSTVKGYKVVSHETLCYVDKSFFEQIPDGGFSTIDQMSGGYMLHIPGCNIKFFCRIPYVEV